MLKSSTGHVGDVCEHVVRVWKDLVTFNEGELMRSDSIISKQFPTIIGIASVVMGMMLYFALLPLSHSLSSCLQTASRRISLKDILDNRCAETERFWQFACIVLNAEFGSEHDKPNCSRPLLFATTTTTTIACAVRDAN
jgi:hypothetical protein